MRTGKRSMKRIALILGIASLLLSCKESGARKQARLSGYPGQSSGYAIADAPIILNLTHVDHVSGTKAKLTDAQTQLPQPEMIDGVFDLVRVKDGDTIVVSDPSGEVTVRLLGIDTPEMRDSRPLVRQFAQQAKQFVTDILSGKRILLGLDPINAGQNHLDRYGRLLAYVYTADDGTHVNAEIIRQGYGFSFVKYPCMYTDHFSALEREARARKVGLWQDQQ